MLQKNMFLIAYDISNSNVRRKLHKLVTKFSISRQKSFFECLLSYEELNSFCNEVKTLINPQTDKVHIFKLQRTILSIKATNTITKKNVFIIN